MEKLVFAIIAGFAGAAVYGLAALIAAHVKQRRAQRRAECFYEKIDVFRADLLGVPPASWRTKGEGH
ncbi:MULTISPECIES: hypothetical protein [Brucella/Ochrobactrum group]|uniref:hypothetical protein n=1 Tax=Ochrobactrum sp. BTU2 TaxID=2856166 RepID=UPI00211AA215|nr:MULTISPECIES: hypothetical protein [Brucella/Ochrobactrum group]MCQ9146182.1 hypothetical protein [Ochrobactrum sp. BTU2]